MTSLTASDFFVDRPKYYVVVNCYFQTLEDIKDSFLKWRCSLVLLKEGDRS